MCCPEGHSDVPRRRVRTPTRIIKEMSAQRGSPNRDGPVRILKSHTWPQIWGSSRESGRLPHRISMPWTHGESRRSVIHNLALLLCSCCRVPHPLLPDAALSLMNPLEHHPSLAGRCCHTSLDWMPPGYPLSLSTPSIADIAPSKCSVKCHNKIFYVLMVYIEENTMDLDD